MWDGRVATTDLAEGPSSAEQVGAAPADPDRARSAKSSSRELLMVEIRVGLENGGRASALMWRLGVLFGQSSLSFDHDVSPTR
jgi:hypothetical protein